MSQSELVLDNYENNNEKLVIFFHRSSYLSNFYKCDFIIDGIKFTSTEQYFHYKKAIIFKDEESAKQILSTNNPMKQKLYGRKVKQFNYKMWNEISYSIMKQGLYAKFTQNSKLYKKLQLLKRVRFVEASPHDIKWGAGINRYHPNITSPSKWPGKNLLGNCLSDIKNLI